MTKTSLVAACVLATMPFAALAQTTCGTPTPADTITIRSSDHVGTPGQTIIGQAIVNNDKGPSIPLVLKLQGTFRFTDKLTIDKSCLTITSDSTATPATLVGDFSATSISTEEDGWFFRTPTTLHNLTLSNLVTTNGGFEINGANILISGNRMSGMRRFLGKSTLILIGNMHAYDDAAQTLPSNRNITVSGNTLSNAYGGIGGGYIRDSLIAQNVLQGVDQGIGLLYYARNNKITGNRGSGFKRMAVELLGNREPATASANLYGNSVTNNVFTNWIRDPLVDADPKTLTATQKNWAGGLLAGISIAKGVNTTVSGNTVICGSACNARAPAGYAMGDMNGMGIEAAGVNTAVVYNTVQNFAVGIWPSNAQAGDPIARTLVDNNRISNTIRGISQQCHGVQLADVVGCNRNLIISNNTISEARDYAIGGDPSWSPNAEAPNRASISTLRRLNSLKISNNVITRTYGAFRGDGADVTKWRYTGIDLIPLNTQSPTQLTVSGNTIKLLGTPPVKEYFPFEFNGIRMRLIAQEDGTWRDPDLVNGSEVLHHYAGTRITGNTVQSDTNFGIGIHAGNQTSSQVYDSLQGVTLSGNKFINLKSAITGSLNGALLSTNSCTTVTTSTGCQQ